MPISEAAGHLHGDDGEAPHAGVAQDLGDSRQGLVVLVELGATDDHGVIRQQVMVQVRVSKGHAIGGQHEIRISQEGCAWRDQLELDRPVSKGRDPRPRSGWRSGLRLRSLEILQARRWAAEAGRWRAGGNAAKDGLFDLGLRLLLLEMYLNRFLVELRSVALFDRERARGAIAETGAETIAKVVTDELGLAVDDLNCPFRARGHTFAATVTKIFVDSHDFSDCHRLLPTALPC